MSCYSYWVRVFLSIRHLSSLSLSQISFSLTLYLSFSFYISLSPPTHTLANYTLLLHLLKLITPLYHYSATITCRTQKVVGTQNGLQITGPVKLQIDQALYTADKTENGRIFTYIDVPTVNKVTPTDSIAE